METIAEDWADADDAEAFAQAANGGREDIRNLAPGPGGTRPERSEVLQRSLAGTIVGPYTKNGQLQLAQVLERTMVPDEAAKCRHILLSAKNAKDEAEMAELGARADSLKRVLRKTAVILTIWSSASAVTPVRRPRAVCTTSSPKAAW